MKCLAVLSGDYKMGAMLFPKNLSSPWTGGTGVTAGRELSASPVGGHSSTWKQRIAFCVDQA